MRQTLFRRTIVGRGTFKMGQREVLVVPVNRVSKEDVVQETEGFVARLEGDERDALSDAGVEPAAITAKELSYRMLLDAGVDESVADALRRRFSLPWSFETDGDLDRRSTEVRGLGEAEREWVAASSSEDWQAFEAARSRASEKEVEEAVDRPWPRPTPLTAVTGVSSKNAARLREAGVNSAERLATINAGEVANALELNVLHVRTWRHNARELIDD